MKKIFMLLTVLLFVFSVSAAKAQTEDETRLETTASEIDKIGSEGKGEKAVTDRLEKEFGVDEARINSLRDKNLGYGEVAITLSLAKNLPGGITDENVDKIVSMRQGPPVTGWGNVAKELGVKLGPVVSGVDKVSSEARKELKKTERLEKKKEKMERREKGEKPEKMERMERPEKPERPDTPGGRR
jgi:Skp family chaperone for outer membrane proteins